MAPRAHRSLLILSVLMFAVLGRAQNAPPSSGDMPGMQMPRQEHPNMPGMQMPAQQHPNMPMGPGSNIVSPMTDDPSMHIGDDVMESPPLPKLEGPVITLSELEQMALSRNPTISQANATLLAAEAAKKQAGLYPNPTVGYYGDEIRGGSFRSGKQGGFFSQTIVLGGKLGAAQRTAEQGREQALTSIGSQRYRVLTDVRTLYYEALAAQRMVDVRHELLVLAQDAVQTSYQLGNVGQADRPDVLQSEVESDQARLDLDSAIQNQRSVWKMLAITVGNPDLPMALVDGKLEDIPQLDEQEWMKRIVTESPQVKMAQQEAERARLSLVEARKVAIPDLLVSGNVSQDNEPLEPPTGRVGIVGGAQIGVQLPLFNRNQGNVERGKAEIARSDQEVQRVQLELRREMETLFRNYTVARSAADRYRTSMLPRAQKAYELYRQNYDNMAAAYPQVLIAQRTLFQLNVDYIQALQAAWVSAMAIKGFGLSDGLSSAGVGGIGRTNDAR